MAELAEASSHPVRQHHAMAGPESAGGGARSIRASKRRTALVSKHRGNEGAPVAAVLHRCLPNVFHSSEMERPTNQHGPVARDPLVSRSQAWIDGLEPC